MLAAPSVDLGQLDPTLSAWDIILALLILIVAWIVSSRRGDQPWRTWLLGLLRGVGSVQIRQSVAE